MKAYYFSKEDRRLRYGDDRLIEDGVTHTIEGTSVLCGHGLHASAEPFDALRYAPGPILWEVELSGDITVGEDKAVASERKYLRHIDATDLLRQFARKQALSVIHLWDAPDVVKEYLETGKEELRAAAKTAAWAATRAATRDATRDASSIAGWAASPDVLVGARASAGQREDFNGIVKKAFEGLK